MPGGWIRIGEDRDVARADTVLRIQLYRARARARPRRGDPSTRRILHRATAAFQFGHPSQRTPHSGCGAVA